MMPLSDSNPMLPPLPATRVGPLERPDSDGDVPADRSIIALVPEASRTAPGRTTTKATVETGAPSSNVGRLRRPPRKIVPPSGTTP